MASTLTQLINEMEDVMDEASAVPFSRKVSVDPDEIYEILAEMKDSLPQEIKQAEWTYQEKDRIIGEAEAEAKRRLEQTDKEISQFKDQAKNQYQKMISDHEITQQARAEADRILQEAATEANKLRQQSYEYIDKLFSSSAENFSTLAQQLEKNRRSILESR
ncbi:MULTISPECIES: ATPase [Anaerococcus]|uniref:ATPase n=1 Tax=Anaerococcus TaxID=165779 RepID=UPI0002FA02EA|nr:MULTISPECIES: ATPase [Anaerococcus]